MPKVSTKRLRFASLIRVSTETQEKQGESLATQRKHNARDVELLNGTIVETYGGQEHGTPGYEKKEVNRLLEDVRKGKFDALIVANADRWSRDNEASIRGLDILQDTGVRFFVSVSEYDLRNPEHRMFLEVSAVIGKFQANHQSKKSILNKIERAKRGIPTCGKLPFGRTYEVKTGKWGIIPEKQGMIKDIAERYVKGESLSKLAEEYNNAHANLWHVLNNQCGDEWSFHFKSERFGVDETVTIQVPRLLPEKLIQDVKKRMVANRTRERSGGVQKHRYLLSGFVQCPYCGYRLTGEQSCSMGKRYYRHAHAKRDTPCPVNPRPFVPADELEGAVIRDLVNLFGNPAAIERSVRAAIPDADKSLKRRKWLEEELTKIDKARDRVLSLVEKDVITDDQAEKKLGEMKEREGLLRGELETLKAALQEMPDEEELKLFVERTRESVIVYDQSGEQQPGGSGLGTLLSMTWEEKRALVEAVFGSSTPDGKPGGVYVTPIPGARRGRRKKGEPLPYAYELRGRFAWRLNAVPVSFDHTFDSGVPSALSPGARNPRGTGTSSCGWCPPFPSPSRSSTTGACR